jgi:hypothetical protein
MNMWAVSEDFPKVPQVLWDKLMSLYFDYADQSLEVHGRIILNPDTLNWRIIIPQQRVSGASVRYDYLNAIDLETGRSIQYPHDFPNHYDVWHTHSHNTMSLKHPSCVDDVDEMNDRKGYCVISSINVAARTYKTCFTVVSGNGKKNKRYFIDDADLGQIVEHLENQEYCRLENQLPFPEVIRSIIQRYFPTLRTTHVTTKSVPIHERDYTLWAGGGWDGDWSYYDKKSISLSADIQDMIRTWGRQAVFQALLEEFEPEFT